MLCQQIFATKTLQTTLAKVFFAFTLCFVKHTFVKIFDVHIVWLVFINYKQQIHRISKCLIRNVYWKGQFVFITNHINAYVVFCLNLAKIFFFAQDH